jgi:predicted nucleic acid-binding protein
MIMDACVLIDFIKADRSVLELVVKYVGPLHVASHVIAEVNEIEDENELVDLGLIIVEPEIEDAFAAATGAGPTSFQDRLCLLTARRYGLTCVTNDKNLRKLCEQEKLPRLWGLELLVELHRCGGIPAEDALDIARKIHVANPKHISERLLKRLTHLIQRSGD